MYRSIETDMAILKIALYIHQIEAYPDISATALIEIFSLVMKNNVFQFSNTFWIQNTSTAMDTPLATNYADLFFAIYENLIILEHSSNFLTYKRYINDIFGIWILSNTVKDDKTQWGKLRRDVDFHYGLK